MKKINLFNYFKILLISIPFLFTSCGKDDTPPVITINGDGTITWSLNSSYSDPGASATDNEDGDVTVTSNVSSSNPDVNKAGTYTITYTAVDAEGNEGTASRTVIVRNDAYYLEGSYGVTEQPGGSAWVQSISTSTTQNNVIIFSKFANYSGNTAIRGKLAPGTPAFVVLDGTQQATNIGTAPNNCNHEFTADGNGNVVAEVSGKWTFSIKFKDQVTGGSGAGCATTAALPYEDTFIQQ